MIEARKYSVTYPEILRNVCIAHNWCDYCCDEEYDKLFYANENGCPINEIATIIWCFSNNSVSRLEVLEV